MKCLFYCSDVKVGAASEAELRSFLKGLFKKHSSIVAECLCDFNPKNMPLEVAADDPLLIRCFSCYGSDDLAPFHDVKQCARCRDAFSQHGGTFTRDKVMHYFGFGKAEADKIPRSTTSGGFYKSKIYVYKIETVVRACNKKYGSLQQMILKRSKGMK